MIKTGNDDQLMLNKDMQDHQVEIFKAHAKCSIKALALYRIANSPIFLAESRIRT
jgi:hypothetical protein